jgi:hypothetical protein
MDTIKNDNGVADELELLPNPSTTGLIELTDELLDAEGGAPTPPSCRWVSCN